MITNSLAIQRSLSLPLYDCIFIRQPLSRINNFWRSMSRAPKRRVIRLSLSLSISWTFPYYSLVSSGRDVGSSVIIGNRGDGHYHQLSNLSWKGLYNPICDLFPDIILAPGDNTYLLSPGTVFLIQRFYRLSQ